MEVSDIPRTRLREAGKDDTRPQYPRVCGAGPRALKWSLRGPSRAGVRHSEGGGPKSPAPALSCETTWVAAN
jgi:hypothetical protein